jgi:predicted transglutaminase-like cysteine proteinase
MLRIFSLPATPAAVLSLGLLLAAAGVGFTGMPRSATATTVSEPASAPSILPSGLGDAAQFVSRPPLTMVWQPQRAASGTYALPVEWRAFRSRILDLGNPLPAKWVAGLDALRGVPEDEQLHRLAAAVMAIPYVSDDRNYGVHDYWARPNEMLAKGGDCEDYAILAYRSLIELGWSDDRLDLVYLKDRKHGFEHVVLAVEIGGERRLIDNNRPDMPRLSDVSYYDYWHAFNGSRLVIF